MISDSPPSRARLWALFICGISTAAWAGFLWQQLLVSRAGEIPFCAFGSDTCADVWDGAFASAVHESSGLPVAAWGVVWGLLAAAVPALGLMRARIAGLGSTLGWCSLGGLVGVAIMLGISLVSKQFCSSCVLYYFLIGAYAAISGKPLAFDLDGLRNAVVGVALAYVVLLYPGVKTPYNVMRSGHAAISSTTLSENSMERLTEMLELLPPPALQALSDSLERFRKARSLPEQRSEFILGSANAPVRIVDFTDTRCRHCRDLHQAFDHLLETVPDGAFSVESRQYPLDGRCNKRLVAREGPETSCLAAKVRICFEGSEDSATVTGQLFTRQADLEPELIYTIAEQFKTKAELESCVTSPETEKRLREDVEYGWLYRPHGTPLVLINGREAPAYPPFILAMILTEANPDHPIFDQLPAPRETEGG